MILLFYIFRFIPQAVGTVTSLPLFSPPFGQGLEMCGPHRRFAPLLPRTLRRIPQAVSTVVTGVCKYAELHSRHCKVSIPQAVSTVTSSPLFSLPFGQGLEMCGPHRRSSAASHPSSHTASGRYCCNFRVTYNQNGLIEMFQYRKR